MSSFLAIEERLFKYIIDNFTFLVDNARLHNTSIAELLEGNFKGLLSIEECERVTRDVINYLHIKGGI